MSADIDTIWARIVAHQGEVFHQKQGKPFTYHVPGAFLRPDTTNRNIPKSDFEKSLPLMPFRNTAILQRHFQGPSYIYAILMDVRIRRGDWAEFPHDVSDQEWGSDKNLQEWSRADVLHQVEIDTLLPLDAKALHVIGLLVQTYNAASHLLYFGDKGPYADYYLHAYLLACSAIELLARCKHGDADLIRGTSDALKRGFGYVIQLPITTNGVQYDADSLDALRNLAAHGVASSGGASVPVFLHVELLDHFPEYLGAAFDSYYRDLFQSPGPEARRNLARAGVEPVLYADRSGQVFRSPIRFAYEKILRPQRLPSDAMECKDWQVYKG